MPSDSQQAVNEFLRYLRVERGLSINTVEAYTRDLAQLAALSQEFEKEVFTLDRADLVEVLARLRNAGRSDASISRFISALSTSLPPEWDSRREIRQQTSNRENRGRRSRGSSTRLKWRGYSLSPNLEPMSERATAPCSNCYTRAGSGSLN